MGTWWKNSGQRPGYDLIFLVGLELLVGPMLACLLAFGCLMASPARSATWCCEDTRRNLRETSGADCGAERILYGMRTTRTRRQEASSRRPHQPGQIWLAAGGWNKTPRSNLSAESSNLDPIPAQATTRLEETVLFRSSLGCWQHICRLQILFCNLHIHSFKHPASPRC